MKKSDLTRRAKLYAVNRNRVNGDNIYDAAVGFESGYRAARADLRKELKYAALNKIRNLYTPVLVWLRPIR
jgi:hypothetical protein